jgi:ABC-type lipoprotein export system ATPase subunit
MRTALLVKQLRSEFAGPFELDLSGGTCAAITGPSGSGKSLFLRMIADLDPNEGEVWLNGRERASMPAPEWRKQTSYVSAESGWCKRSNGIRSPGVDVAKQMALNLVVDGRSEESRIQIELTKSARRGGFE